MAGYQGGSRGFTGAAHGDIADGDNGARQAERCKYAEPVEKTSDQ